MLKKKERQIIVDKVKRKDRGSSWTAGHADRSSCWHQFPASLQEKAMAMAQEFTKSNPDMTWQQILDSWLRKFQHRGGWSRGSIVELAEFVEKDWSSCDVSDSDGNEYHIDVDGWSGFTGKVRTNGALVPVFILYIGKTFWQCRGRTPKVESE
jgi:hypothetical protein